MRFLALVATILAAIPAVLAQTDGNWQCTYGTREVYPKDSAPEGRLARNLERCFRAMRYTWEPGRRCRGWWIYSKGHRWHNANHCWQACFKCMQGGITSHEPEVYCSKFKVNARCVMSYMPWILKDVAGAETPVDYSTLNLPGNATSPEEFPDLYDPAWDEDEYDPEDVDDLAWKAQFAPEP